MESCIDKVRKRKNNAALLIDGINYGRVIAMQTYDTSFKSIIKEMVRLFCFNYTIETNEDKNNVYLFYSLRSAGRKDYDEIICLFKQAVENINEVNLIQYKSFKRLFKKIYLLIRSTIKLRSKNVDDSFMTAIVLTQYKMLKKYIDESLIFDKPLLIVTFCDAYGLDNLLTQIANNNGITTVTLQHGQYRVLTKGNEIADAEAYENFISDYMLTWGQATVDEFVKVGIDKNRLLKVGALKNFSFNKRLLNHSETNVFGIVLGGEVYKDTNIEMINFANSICERYGLKYYLRMHPRNSYHFYIHYCKSKYLSEWSSNIRNADYAHKVDFSLIHMTGVFVELLSINSPIIIYKNLLLEEIFQIKPYCISNIEEFDDFYKTLLTNHNNILDDQYRRYKYFNESGNVLCNYRTAMDDIVKKGSKKLLSEMQVET